MVSQFGIMAGDMGKNYDSEEKESDGERFVATGPEAAEQESDLALPSADARDYFADGVKEKLVRTLDPNPDHHWEDAKGDVRIARDGLKVFEGVARHRDGTAGFLIAGERPDGTVCSDEIVVSWQIADQAIELFKTASLYLPIELVQAHTERLAEYLRHAEHEPLAQITAMMESFFAVLPKDPDAMPLELLPNLPEKHRDGGPTAAQQEAFQKVVRAASAVLPPELLLTKLDAFLADIPYTMNAYQNYFPALLQDIAKWAVVDRPQYPPRYGAGDTGDMLSKFAVDKSISRECATQEDAETYLALQAAEPMPPLHRLHGKPRVPEIVPLEKLVGGNGIEDWSRIPTSENRGMKQIWKLMQEMQNGQFDCTLAPMKVAKYQGKYYVDGDGRHRAAALKALGVERAPMLVAEYE